MTVENLTTQVAELFELDDESTKLIAYLASERYSLEEASILRQAVARGKYDFTYFNDTYKTVVRIAELVHSHRQEQKINERLELL